MARYDAIVIGGGLGGLSAAAHLALAGRKVLLLEKEAELGGKCRETLFQGHRFDIGPDYFSRNSLGLFQNLGLDLQGLGLRARVLCDGHVLTVPPGWRTFGELRRFGLSAGGALAVGARIGARVALGRPRDAANYQELVERVTSLESLRSVLQVGGYFTGFPPALMPAAWFDLLFGRRSGYAAPIYPRGGSSRLPARLAEAVRAKGGEIRTGARVEGIVIEGGAAIGVQAGGRFLESSAVVSAVGLKATVMELSDPDLFPPAFIERVSALRSGLEFASVFAVLRKDAVAPLAGVELYARFPADLSGAIREAVAGHWPEDPPYTLSLPAGVDPEAAREDGWAATIKFLVPAGGAADGEVERRARAILGRADELLPGFGGALVALSVASPGRYKREWGMSSAVSSIADEAGREKPGVALPIRGLYAAGATVGGIGGGTQAALESGAEAARTILGAAS